MRTDTLKFIVSLMMILLVGNHILAQTNEMKTHKPFEQIFPQGDKLPEQFSQFFTGQAYLAQLSNNDTLGTHIANVTFEPSCRNNWHSHTGGQLLIVTAGRGYYQEKGKPSRELHAGDVVEIAPDAVHWHGAAPDSWFSHLAVECNTATNRNTWLEPVDDEQYAAATSHAAKPENLSDKAVDNLTEWLGDSATPLDSTDPELAAIFGNFAFGEVQEYGTLGIKTRIMVTMASAIAQHTKGTYLMTLRAALHNGITPVEIKEVLYHAVPYAGMAKVGDMLTLANDFLQRSAIELPLEPQASVSTGDRFDKGLALQKSIFGDSIDRMYEVSPADELHIQKYLSANCFGDYQTRTVLDAGMRELLTFSILISLGGCEPQVKGHIAGNLNVGNSKATMLAVATQLLPYNGYPRTLNAIACLNEVIPEIKK